MRLMDMRSKYKEQDTVADEVLMCSRYYCLSILDKHHHPDINFEQGMNILRMCTDELQRRLPIDFKGMTVKLIKKDGIQELEYDTSKQVLSA